MAKSSKQEPQADRLQLVMQSLAAAESLKNGQANSDLAYIEAMRDFFEADGCIWVTFEMGTESRVTKKEIGKPSEFEVTRNLRFEKGLLYTSFQSDSLLEISDLPAHPDFYDKIDALKFCKSQFMVCSPVQNHSKKFGVIALVNPRNYFIESQDRVYFQLFVNALSGYLYLSMVLNELQATDVDLQVSRQQLIGSRNSLRLILDTIPESLYLVDAKFKIKAINLSRADRIGLLPADLVGKSCHDVFFNQKIPCPDCLAAETFKTGKAQYKRCHGWNAENEKREWDINTYPVLNLNERVDLVVISEQDITERRKLEAEIIQNEKLTAVGHLAAIVAHEINNPLTSILANSQMLRLDLDPEENELVESVKLIELAGVRATKVVENLQSMIRQGEFEFQYFDLNQSIQNALFLISHEFISRQITIRFNRGEGLPELYGSENHLQGVWTNLLMNSIEAIDTGKGEIKIDTLYNEGNFYVEIKDTGIGISEDVLGRIFEPFFTTKKSGRGTGLGLSLARRIIRAHGGQIHVESSLGKGTRFTIILPERQERDVGVIPKEDLGLI